MILNFSGKKVLVVGLARSGMAAIRVLHKRGAIVTAYDAKTETALQIQRQQLEDMGIPLYFDDSPPVSQELYDLVVVSPGVPLDSEPVNSARQLKIPIMGELELAYLIKSDHLNLYSITGTNGKTTTTSLLQHILSTDGRDCEAGGNIGVALCNLVEAKQDGTICVEASSFQLETTQQFHPHICGILNITEDHLNRHKTMEEYVRVKARIFRQQNDQDYVILNYEDELLRSMQNQVPSKLVFFSVERSLSNGLFIQDGTIYVNWQGNQQAICLLDKIQLRGKHNLENILCAVAMALVAGVEAPIIEKALNSFRGVRHRLEEVVDSQGILYINDSKGTNPDSTMMALKAFDRPVILIAGGQPKGGSYHAVAELISTRVKELVILGEARDLIKTAVLECGFTNIHEVDDFPSAVYRAHQLARAGDVVLLSPACASWDMFPSYEHRGDLFCELVRKIVSQEE